MAADDLQHLTSGRTRKYEHASHARDFFNSLHTRRDVSPKEGRVGLLEA